MAKRLSIFSVAFIFVLLLAGVNAHAFKLPDTGQTLCYNSGGAELASCAGTGQDGEYNINPMSYTDNGDGTVTDNNTGLMWQKEDDGNTYNGYQAAGIYDATANPDTQSVCGALNLGGYSDWRLPSQGELMTIVDYGMPYPGPTIDTRYFSNAKAATYYADFGWDEVSFVNGAAGPSDASLFYFYVRCVRGTPLTSNCASNSDGTVTDNNTGLMWQKDLALSGDWHSSLLYCNELALSDHADWRLPNIKEMSYAIMTNCLRDLYFYDGYWTSTTTTETGGAFGVWYFGFTYPYVGGTLSFATH